MTENIATTDLGFQDYDFRPSVCPSCGGVLVGPSGRYVAGEEGRVRWSTVCVDCGHGVGWETYSEFGDEGHHTRFDWVSEDGESAVRVPDDAELDANSDFYGDDTVAYVQHFNVDGMLPCHIHADGRIRYGFPWDEDDDVDYGEYLEDECGDGAKGWVDAKLRELYERRLGNQGASGR